MVMALGTINTPLDPETAEIYSGASEEQQRKMRLLVSLWLRDFVASPRPLDEIMGEAGEMAEERGLTPEMLKSLLNAE
jgi:hypothetical protein